jgi:hypothetical protein
VPTPSRYVWEPRASRYRDSRGRFVPATAVRAELDKSIEQSGQSVRALSEQLQRGEINLRQWQLGMIDEIRSSQLAGVASSKGGFAQMTQADYGWAGQRIREQYGYLDNFARQIASGEQRLDGTFPMRAEQYVKASRASHEAMRRREASKRGEDLMRNILHPADHCPDCIAQAALGWIPIDDPRYIPIGQRQCRMNDRCTIEFSALVQVAA